MSNKIFLLRSVRILCTFITVFYWICNQEQYLYRPSPYFEYLVLLVKSQFQLQKYIASSFNIYLNTMIVKTRNIIII